MRPKDSWLFVVVSNVQPPRGSTVKLRQGHDMREELLRRLAAYERLRNELADDNPIRLLIEDAMDSLRHELVQHDARSMQEMVQKLRRRGRPPQKPRDEAR